MLKQKFTKAEILCMKPKGGVRVVYKKYRMRHFYKYCTRIAIFGRVCCFYLWTICLFI